MQKALTCRMNIFFLKPNRSQIDLQDTLVRNSQNNIFHAYASSDAFIQHEIITRPFFIY